MKKNCTVLFILFIAVNAAFAQTTITSSSVIFHIKNLGINVDGRFGGIKGDINFNPSQLAGSSITATIDAATVSTDNNTRDGHLRGEKYFYVEKYPVITMKSVSFKHKKGDNYEGKFNLSIKGKTQPVIIPFTYTETGGKAAFNGSFEIKRRDFDVGGSSMVLGDDVTIDIKAETTNN